MADYSGKPEIETKNLAYIEDAMAFEGLASKKCRQYESMLTDPAQRDLAKRLAGRHKAHFDALYNYLQSHS